jgi:hypothetical protein
MTGVTIRAFFESFEDTARTPTFSTRRRSSGAMNAACPIKISSF